jgi:hypothetical protein
MLGAEYLAIKTIAKCFTVLGVVKRIRCRYYTPHAMTICKFRFSYCVPLPALPLIVSSASGPAGKVIHLRVSLKYREVGECGARKGVAMQRFDVG